MIRHQGLARALMLLWVMFAGIPAARAEPASPAAVHDDSDVRAGTDAVTHHCGTFHGHPLHYTVKAGRLAVAAPDGGVDAQMFYVAYTRDDGDPATRPVMFITNGGPGAATAWLHLGGLGPRKLRMNSDGSTPPAPARLDDNPDSPLDRADLVFIDAPGTGFSRLANDAAKARILTKAGDLDAFAGFVETWLRRNARFTAPLYLFGESYGAFRMAGLADGLVRRGVPVKGVVLLSSILDAGTLMPGMANDLPYQLDIPSYAMVAAFHHRLSPARGNGEALLAEAEQWARQVYGPALAQGNQLSARDRQRIIAGLMRYTGLSAQVIAMHNLRIDVPDFMKYLNADRGLVTGRTDGRMVGPPPAAQVEEPFYDPAMGAVTPAFASAANQYLLGELRVETPLAYRIYARDVAERFQLGPPVVFGSDGYPQTLTSLQSALVKNRDFRVLAMQGQYDLATPYMSLKYAIDHMPLPATIRANLRFVLLPTGHMAYLDAAGLRRMNDEVVTFIDRGSAGPAP